MALARLRGCAGSPEPSLVAFVISTIISWAGSFDYASVRQFFQLNGLPQIQLCMMSVFPKDPRFRLFEYLIVQIY